jgi:hypothetical protein
MKKSIIQIIILKICEEYEGRYSDGIGLYLQRSLFLERCKTMR